MINNKIKVKINSKTKMVKTEEYLENKTQELLDKYPNNFIKITKEVLENELKSC